MSEQSSNEYSAGQTGEETPAQTATDTDVMPGCAGGRDECATAPDGQCGQQPAAQESGAAGAEAAAQLDICHPDDALEPVTLEDLPPSMQAACARAGWTRLMPVQSTALPYLMDGRDIMIQSRTGSGKTGTYLLPMVPALRPDRKFPQALVLVPTRELALQVAHEASTLFEGTGIIVAALYGGVGYQKQLDQLRAGAQLIVGTPGRILDHILRHALNLDQLRALVFDEADRMLSIGFYPDMKEVQRYLPKRRIYTSLFSATYPQYVLNLAAEFMTTPAMLSLSQKQVYVAEVQHCFCRVQPMDKDRALIRLLEIENPASAIIFCNTKANVHYVTGVLKGFGYNADELSADLTQSRREEVMRQVREGRTRLLVATDVAARGI
ncbi:MAG: DEAD/DEAH box helicase, partial [Desulfovibrionaceae bacterium]|nr:DEAD/DEAH box helicase [Desulfovibrionaceae bacterium]